MYHTADGGVRARSYAENGEPGHRAPRTRWPGLLIDPGADYFNITILRVSRVSADVKFAKYTPEATGEP